MLREQGSASTLARHERADAARRAGRRRCRGSTAGAATSRRRRSARSRDRHRAGRPAEAQPRSRCRAGATELTLPGARGGRRRRRSSARSSAATGASSRPTSAARAARSRSSCARRSRARLAGARLLGLRFARVSEIESHAHGGGPILRGVAVLGPLQAGGDDARLALRRLDGRRRRARRRRPSARTRSTTSSARRPTRSGGCGSRPTTSRSRRSSARRSPSSRATTGKLAIQLPVGTLRLRVVGTVRHFPSILGPAVVVDRDALAVALHALQPGAGTANELWLDTASRAQVADALAAPPFDTLDVESRAGLRHTLDADPLTRGTILLLLAATGDRAAARPAGRVLPRRDRRARRPRRAARPGDAGRRAARAAPAPAAAAAARGRARRRRRRDRGRAAQPPRRALRRADADRGRARAAARAQRRLGAARSSCSPRSSAAPR